MSKFGIRLLAFALVLPFGCGCADQASCDADQELKHGLCRDLAVGAAGAGQSDGSGGAGTQQGTAGSSAGDAGASGSAACDEKKTFDDSCRDDSECGCDAPSCAVLPGSSSGFCTSQCLEDPAACPSDWECVDLSRFGTYPKTCLPAGFLGL